MSLRGAGRRGFWGRCVGVYHGATVRSQATPSHPGGHGPIWEANHVWLIFVAIILFNGFPPAFVALNRVLLMSPFSGVIGHCIPWRGFCISRYGAESEVLQRSSESGFDGHSVFP